ncbi:MAG: toprim domain-containing protein [Firmicutes bacterium]|nr:toprim domain-containing protein [Bacillota bacterium]
MTGKTEAGQQGAGKAKRGAGKADKGPVKARKCAGETNSIDTAAEAADPGLPGGSEADPSGEQDPGGAGTGIGVIDLEGLAVYYHGRLNSEAREYLRKRGLATGTIERFRLGYDDGGRIGFLGSPGSVGDYFRGRITFPITDPSGRTVCIVGRSIDDTPPKYRNLPAQLTGVDSFFNEAVLAESDVVFLCEGIIDALTLIQAGFPAAALLGAAGFQPGWVERFAGKQVFICFDSDDLGRKGREIIARLLSTAAKEIYILTLPQGIKDVNDLFVEDEDAFNTFLSLVRYAVEGGKYSQFPADIRSLPAFLQEVVERNRGKQTSLPTGFPSLDAVLNGGLQEGVHVVLGPPAGGKTSLLKQIADFIAGNGFPVLFLSLEMSAFELWARSIARLLRVKPGDVLAGKVDPGAVAEANQGYVATAGRIWTLEGDEDTDLDLLAHRINQTFNELGTMPVVFIDYLQRLSPPAHLRGAPFSLRNSEAMLGLKRVARHFGVPVVVAAAMDAPEYRACQAARDVQDTADVIMVIERAAPSYEDGDRQEAEVELDLAVTKNRMGSPGKIRLTLLQDWGFFTERGRKETP